MHIRLTALLNRLGQLRHGAPPSRTEVAAGAGLPMETAIRIFSSPNTRPSPKAFDSLVSYLFREFRPHVSDSVSDNELLNRLRYELLEFDRIPSAPELQVCPFRPEGKLSLRDVFGGA